MQVIFRKLSAVIMVAGLVFSLILPVHPVLAQEGVLPATAAWPLTSIGIPRLHASFPQEPTRTEKSIYSGGNLIKGAVYSVYIRELDWKFEVMVIPHSVKPKGKEAAVWAEEETNRNILTSGASVLSSRTCSDKLFSACRSYDLITPDGLIIKGRTGVYDSYVISLISSGKQPYFNDGVADFFLNSLVLPKTNIPLSSSPSSKPNDKVNDVSRFSWSVIPTDYFDVALPGEPEQKKYILKADSFNIVLQAWQYLDKSNNISFNITRHQPQQIIADQATYLQTAMKESVTRQGGSLLLQQWVPEDGGNALEFIYSAKKEMYKCRYFLYQGALFQLAVKGNKSLVLGPVGAYFFNSFGVK